MTDEFNLASLTEKYAGDIGLLSAGLRNDDEEDFEEAALRLTTGVLKEIPWIGAPTGFLIERAFARSSFAQMKRAVAESTQEDKDRAFYKTIADSVGVLLEEALIQIVRVSTNLHEETRSELLAQLGAPNPALEAFRQDFAARADLTSVALTGPNVTIKRMNLTGKATGVDIERGSTGTADIEEVHASGESTVIRLK